LLKKRTFRYDSFASLSAIGNLTFGNNATASLYWGDSFDSLYEGWTQDYVMSDLFSATGTMTGYSFFGTSSFADSGFDYAWNGNVLTLTYLGTEVPEPATLVVLGLAWRDWDWQDGASKQCSRAGDASPPVSPANTPKTGGLAPIRSCTEYRAT